MEEKPSFSRIGASRDIAIPASWEGSHSLLFVAVTLTVNSERKTDE
jgi:hypothetical protein